MSRPPTSWAGRAAAKGPATPFEALARRLILARVSRLTEGCLTLREGGASRTFGCDAAFPVRAVLTVHRPSFWPDVLLGGSVGAGEAYMAGAWTADDLPAVARILVRNRAVLDDLDEGLWGRGAAWMRRALHAARRNSLAGSRRNIAAHYDLGNDFYALFLDPTMTYSCALFEREDASLEEAQRAKVDRMCRKLGLEPGMRVLEIGTGWGALAMHAASRYGCRVTTTTLSRRQADYARRAVAEAGLGDRVEVLLEDYRRLTGTFDRVVSIEMVEAVGHQYLGDFMRACAARLTPEGLLGLQAITIEDAAWDAYTRGVDFIKRYIFPGSCLVSVTALAETATRVSDLRAVHLEDLTAHYVRTLALWRGRFLSRLDEVRAMGFSESFIRMWEFYLAYCEGGFAERYIGDVQMVFARPRAAAAPVLAMPGAPGPA